MTHGLESVVRYAILLVLLVIAGQASASAQSRWVEIDYNDRTTTYDLTTVYMIEPGKFTILERTVDHSDVMRFSLAVLASLRSYCTRPDGRYPAQESLFMLGKPDMPIEEIEVKTKPPALGTKSSQLAS